MSSLQAVKAQHMPSGPVAGTRLSEAYVTLVARGAFLWGWPLVNLQARLETFRPLKAFALSGGVLPLGPVNEVCMLRDYIEPSERAVACPNQDVVYGQAMLDMSKEPVVVQVPDFGERFFVYQVVDQRTDSFARIGKMYGTKPGFYLLAGPGWNGDTPKGIAEAFRSPTNIGFIAPRVFIEDASEDKQAVQPILRQIRTYPLSRFTGEMQTYDWSTLPSIPGASGDEETKWVVPEKFFDLLPTVLDNVPPMPGEEAQYAIFRSVLDAAANNPRIKDLLVKAAVGADAELVQPLFEFRNYGLALPHNWTTQNNGAAFGTDYFTRTAVAKSNIFVNTPRETKYFYQDLDAGGERLNSANRYTVTFAKGQLPPVRGFWSLTMYNRHHLFEPNEIKRYSVGTKSKSLKYADDGSLTVYVQSSPPPDRANWLPSPEEGDFSLYVRAYWPEDAVLNGTWTPPPVTRVT